MKITQEQVLDALRKVDDPDLKKDLVSLNMIENVVISDQSISFANWLGQKINFNSKYFF